LNVTGLLPPSRDVERSLHVLKGHLATAWSGWEYLSKNVALDMIDAFFAAAPPLATGIIVRDGDLSAAVDHLRAAMNRGDLTLDAPLCIASNSAVANVSASMGSTRGSPATSDTSATNATTSVVLPPSDLAVVDRDAGQRALERRQEAIDRYDAEIHAAERDQRGFDTLAAQMETYRHKYPSGWVEKQRGQIDELQVRVHEESARVQECTTRIGALVEEERQDAQRQLQLSTQARTTELAMKAVEGYVARHPDGAAKYQAQADRLMEHARLQRRAQDEANESATVSDKTANGLSSSIVQLGVNEKHDRDLVTLIQYREQGDLVAIAGDVEILRHQYESLRADYEGRTDTSAATALLSRAREDMLTAERDLKRALKAEVTREAAEAALAALKDPSEAQGLRDKAQEQYSSAVGATSRPAVERTGAEAAFDTAHKAVVRLGAPVEPVPVPTSVDAAAMARDEALRIRDEQEHDAQSYDEMVTNGEKNAQVFGSQIREMSQIQSRLRELTEQRASVRDALVAGPIPERVPSIVMTAQGMATISVVDQWTDIATSCSKEVHEIESRQRELNDALGSTFGTIKRWLAAEEFVGLRTPMLSNLRQWEAAQFEGQFDDVTVELETRRQTLDDKIQEIDRDRNTLIDTARSAAFDGVHLLQQLGRQSKVPATIAGIGGRDFLQVKLSLPNDVAEQKQRLGTLIDELVLKGTMPKGIEFVQHAVRRLAGETMVKVLFPDPDTTPRYVPITDLAKLSGGERLTCATLMYCALARMRARNRGKLEQPSGVLLCDNPVGKASRPKFLELQREVARKMGIQLLYFTGVNDLEALRMLPGCIRLRNNHLDRSSGKRLVEHESAPTGRRASVSDSGMLEGARIMRDEVTAIDQVNVLPEGAGPKTADDRRVVQR